MRGIVLAGGRGTRLRPLTAVSSKQLLPVYDKPMIYYPLAVLMLTEIREILVISSSEHLAAYRDLLGDGTQLGLRLSYAAQDVPRGLADAILLGREFIGGEPVCLILGDNIFYGTGLADVLRRERDRLDGCTLFGYSSPEPERFGVATVDAGGRVTALEEKPRNAPSDLVVTGLYMYGPEAVGHATRLVPSERGELEITDLNRRFVDEGRARLVGLGRGTAWFDAGTYDSLLDAGIFVQLLQKRQGIRMACVEEIAYRMGFITAADLTILGKNLSDSSYGDYVRWLGQNPPPTSGASAEYG